MGNDCCINKMKTQNKGVDPGNIPASGLGGRGGSSSHRRRASKSK
jgi:hypothetical protein